MKTQRAISLLSTFLILGSLQAQQPMVSTCMGTGQPGLVNGSIDSARLNHPFGLFYATDGSLYVADANNHCIRLIYPNSQASTLAGTGVAGFQDGPLLTARFNSPSGLCVDADSGIVYVCDFQNQRIRKIQNGMVSTLAGTGVAGYLDGPGSQAQFNYPRGICRDAQGNLYIADSWNHRIRKITPDGTVSTYAGGGSAMGVGSIGSLLDGQDTAARFYTPSGITIDLQGNLYVADAYNHRIRKIDTQQLVTTLAGSGPTGQNQGGFQDGPANTARFNTPTEVFYTCCYCPDNGEAVFVSDTYNNRIRAVRQLTGSPYVSTYAGTGQAGFVDGPADSARFNYPRGLSGIFGNASCFMFLADYNNNVIRSIHDYFTGMDEENSISRKVKVYPNPCSGSLYVAIEGHSASTLRLELYDILGRRVIQPVESGESKAVLDLSGLKDGWYLLKVIFSDGIILTSKVILRASN